MGMRVGKSKTLLDDWGQLVLTKKSLDLLIIAPAGVYATWETAIADDVPDVIAPKVFRWVSSDKQRRTSTKPFLDHRGPRILIMNIEALSTVMDAKLMCINFLKRGRGMIAIDESTVIKNMKAKRTKFVITMLAGLAEFRRILSGLPTPRSPLDAYAQFFFLDPDILKYRKFADFQREYAILRTLVVGGRRIEIPVGYKNLDKLASLIDPHSYRVRLEDCYDMPPKDYSIREVTMTEEQERVYKEVKKQAFSELESGDYVVTTEVITKILRLHQVLCGHVGDEQGQQHTIPENRTSELIELLEEYDGKAIIWCSYDHDIRKVSDALRKAFGENSVAQFWGENRSVREEEERRFLQDPECRFMVATPSAGGRGRTWTVANLVVYYSNTNNLEHRSQSEERAQGVGKNVSVAYVDLVVRGTVDEKILQALRDKIDLAGIITRDNYKQWLV